MKKILSLIILLGGMVLLSHCRKNDNEKLPALVQTPIPLLTIDETTDFLIEDPNQFSSKFNVGLYFKDNTPPRTSDIAVTMNGDYSNVKILKTGVTTLPAVESVTAKEMIELFGKTTADIKAGDYFEIGLNMTLDNGQVVPAFLDGQSPYGGDAMNLDGSSPTIKYRKVCPLDLDEFTGTFTIDDPDFWEGSYPVTISRDGAEGLKITGFIENPSAVVKVTIDPKKHSVIIPKQTYLASYIGYHNFTIVGAGELDACNKIITASITNSVTEGSFGTVTIKIHK